MSQSKLARLAQLAEVIRAKEMSRLQPLSAACDGTGRALAALSKPERGTDDPALWSMAQLHGQWAQNQRVQLSRKLALQKAAMHEQREVTARAHARAEILQRLVAKNRDGKSRA